MGIICGQTRSSVNNPVYPDYYGGTYANDDGDLVVLITESGVSTRASNEVQTIMKEENVIFSTCKNSYNELQQVVDSISWLMETGANFSSNIGMFGIDVINNKVLVCLRDDSENKKKQLLDNINCDFIKIGWCSPIEEHLSLECGAAIFSDGRGSVGYRAIDSMGNKGIVTAGHCCDVNDSIYYSPNEIGNQAELIGKCIYSAHDDGYIDAAFCEITDPVFQPSNILPVKRWGISSGSTPPTNIEYRTLSTQLAQPPVGLIINSIGSTSGWRSGRIRFASHYIPDSSGKIGVSDAIIADYISSDGDSGGIVYAYQSSNDTRYTVGINKGRIEMRIDGVIDTLSTCVKAYMINQRLGLTRY